MMHVSRPLALLASLLAAPVDAGTEQTLTPTVLVTRSPTDPPTPEPTPSPTPAPTPCVCEDQQWTYSEGDNLCVRGCGVDGNGVTYPNENRCCNVKFGLGSRASGECDSYDMCATPSPTLITPSPTPFPSPNPTSGSTPTVGTETTTPPTCNNICNSEQACEAKVAELGLSPFSVDTNESFPAKGCFGKNGKGFYSPGTAEEEASRDLGGVRYRIFCGCATVTSQLSNVENLDFVRVQEESAGAAARVGLATVLVGVAALLV